MCCTVVQPGDVLCCHIPPSTCGEVREGNPPPLLCLKNSPGWRSGPEDCMLARLKEASRKAGGQMAEWSWRSLQVNLRSPSLWGRPCSQRHFSEARRKISKWAQGGVVMPAFPPAGALLTKTETLFSLIFRRDPQDVGSHLQSPEGVRGEHQVQPDAAACRGAREMWGFSFCPSEHAEAAVRYLQCHVKGWSAYFFC